jgi:hypothetical protein
MCRLYISNDFTPTKVKKNWLSNNIYACILWSNYLTLSVYTSITSQNAKFTEAKKLSHNVAPSDIIITF